MTLKAILAVGAGGAIGAAMWNKTKPREELWRNAGSIL